MKRRNFTEKSNAKWTKTARFVLDQIYEEARKRSIEFLEFQYHWGSDDCVAYDEDGNELNDGEFDRTIAEEIVDYYLSDGYFMCTDAEDKNGVVELINENEMIKNIAEFCKENKDETWYFKDVVNAAVADYVLKTENHYW